MLKIRETLALFLCAALILTFGPVSAFASVEGAEKGNAAFVDMPSGWAKEGLLHGVENGLIKGYETVSGKEIHPNGNITRAELATAVNRAFGATAQAELEGVTDVKAGAWYAPELGKAVAMGTMTKASKMRPNDPVTRQEAFTILARAYKLEGGTKEDLAGFKDGGKVASYAVSGIGAMLKAGYISGSNGGVLNPGGYMTRAEFAKVMDNLTAVYVSQSGEYSGDVSGNLVVNAAGAVLKDMKVKGNIIIAEGVGEGDVDIDNVTVDGDILAKAGGDHSIHLNNVNVSGEVVLAKAGNALRLVVNGDSGIKEVKVKCDAIVDALGLKAGNSIGKVELQGERLNPLALMETSGL